jgi:photosystem II stability/assembly factor-like uncharacterized protein
MFRFPNSAVCAAILLAGLSRPASAGGWSWRNPSPTGVPLQAVTLIDSNTAFAVGLGGTILRTTDGGLTWTELSSGTVANLYAVAFTDAHTGTVVGSSGTILRTTDGGATWVSQWPAAYYQFNGVFFLDANTGWAVGGNYTVQASPPASNSGRILHTTDRGASWTLQYAGGFGLNAVAFTDANTGVAVGANGTILRTANGGSPGLSNPAARRPLCQPLLSPTPTPALPPAAAARSCARPMAALPGPLNGPPPCMGSTRCPSWTHNPVSS